MVEGVMRAIFEDEFAAFVGAAGAEDLKPGGARDLDGGGADAAAGAMDQDRFARSRERLMEKRPVGGGVGNAERGALGEGNIPGQGMHSLAAANGIFSVSACNRCARVNAVAFLEADHSPADRFDDACG